LPIFVQDARKNDESVMIMTGTAHEFFG